MGDAVLYAVVVSNRLQEGYDRAAVAISFAKLLKMEPQKAGVFLSRTRILKRDIDLQTARQYKQRLESIGLIVALKASDSESKVKAQSAAETATSSAPLTPLSTPSNANPSLALAVEQSASRPSLALEAYAEPPLSIVSDARMEQPQSLIRADCPKCGTTTSTGDEQCGKCGVFLHKVNPSERETFAHRQNYASASDTRNSDEDNFIDGIHQESLILGVLVAALGVFVWRFTAGAMGYEPSVLALIFGAAIGFVVSTTGSYGRKAAIACALLVVGATLGGKLFTSFAVKSGLEEQLVQTKDAVAGIYNHEMRLAKRYLESVTDDGSRLLFMVDNAYVDATHPAEISSEERSIFTTNFEPRLERIGNTSPTYDEWFEYTYKDEIETAELSAISLMFYRIGYLDGLFIILGTWYAWHLAARQRSPA